MVKTALIVLSPEIKEKRVANLIEMLNGFGIAITTVMKDNLDFDDALNQYYDCMIVPARLCLKLWGEDNPTQLNNNFFKNRIITIYASTPCLATVVAREVGIIPPLPGARNNEVVADHREDFNRISTNLGDYALKIDYILESIRRRRNSNSLSASVEYCL